MLNSKSVAYPGEGSSGRYFVCVVERMGLTKAMETKMRPMPAEYNVEVVASGEVDMVVVVASRIQDVKGVQPLGLIPKELHTWIGFTAGLASKAKEVDAARAFLRFMTTPEAEKILRDKGVEPFVL
jgi:molybdate transport system substrate-binding protein